MRTIEGARQRARCIALQPKSGSWALGRPGQHTEAITNRPLLLYGVGRQTRHANQTTITIASTHAKADHVRRTLAEVATFFNSLRQGSRMRSRSAVD